MLLGPFKGVPRTNLAPLRAIEALPGSFNAPRTGQTIVLGRRRPVLSKRCNLYTAVETGSPYFILETIPPPSRTERSLQEHLLLGI